MAANDLLIQCFNPNNLAQVMTFTKEDRRSSLEYGSTVPEGDAFCTWTLDCDVLARLGEPWFRSRVKVYDPVRGTWPWVGVLDQPTERFERGRLTEMDFRAVGCATGTHREFPDPIVFGSADHAATTSNRHIITDLGEAVQFGLTITPLINGTESFIDVTTGITLGGDTENFRGHSAAAMWTALCTLTAQLGTPFIWLVYADNVGSPALHFLAAPTAPEYFENGTSKETSLDVNAAEIANLIYVAFKGDMIVASDAGTAIWQTDGATPTLDYSATPDIQTHFVDVTEEVPSLSEAEGFAGGLYNKFNQRIATSGTVVLDRDLRALYAGSSTPEIIPITEVRAGKPIRLRIRKTKYLEAQLDMLIMSARYSEKDCTMTISPTAIDSLGRDARLVTLLAGRNFFNWSIVSAQFAAPMADLMKARGHNPSTAGFDPDFHDPNQPGARAPTVFMNSGWTLSGGPGAKKPVGNSAPSYETGLKPVVLHSGLVLMAVTTDSSKFGTLGAMVHPQELPPERVNYPAVFRTSDDDGALTDGERGGQDVQECWIETITIKTLGGVTGTCTVTVDVYNWDDDTTTTAVFTIPLAGVDHNRIVLDGSDDDHQPIRLKHGDHIIWNVADADSDFVVKCALSGWKNWAEFPVLVGPDWIPGNS